MRSNTLKAFSAAIVGTLALSACTSLVIEPSEMTSGVDRTVGRPIDANAAAPMVLVTITDSMHETLSQGESVAANASLPPMYARFMAQLYRDFGLRRVADWPLGAIDVRCLVFEAQRPVTGSMLDRLRAHQFVETAQTMNYFVVAGDRRYDDPYFELQNSHVAMQVPSSHGWSTGQGVVIAVIDTGFDTAHADLKSSVLGIRNFVDRDYTRFRGDIHGTAVAGVIAAAANNGTGIVGVAPDARILGLKACAQPTAREATCTSFTLAKALNFAVAEGADVINLSLAGPRDALLERLVKRAVDSGAVVVGAAGLADADGFPATAEGVIGVSMHAGDDTISAPGENVVTTVPGDEYDFFSGNSFAAAQVSGVVALIRQRKPHISASVVSDLLEVATNRTDGFTNACHALARIVGAAPCSDEANVANSPRP